MSTVVDVQYSGGISSVQWRDTISTVEDIQYSGGISSVQWRDIISTVEGYHQYSGGMSPVQCKPNSSKKSAPYTPKTQEATYSEAANRSKIAKSVSCT